MTRRAPAAPSIVVATLALVSIASLTSAVSCGGVRGADSPLSAAAQRVRVVAAADDGCNKIGKVRGVGRDLDEQRSRAQATDGAREEAAKLGGDEVVLVEETTDMESVSGGTAYRITKSAEVYGCAKK